MTSVLPGEEEYSVGSEAERLMRDRLEPLRSATLDDWGRAADMEMFGFHEAVQGATLEFSLHLQCPWHLVEGDRLVTGAGDIWHPPGDWVSLDEYKRFRGDGVTRRDELLRGFFDRHPDGVAVTSIACDAVGYLRLDLSDACRLVALPQTSWFLDGPAEHWRFFPADGEHLVVTSAGVYTVAGEDEGAPGAP